MRGVSTSHPPTRSFQPRRRALPPARAERYQRLLTQWALPVTGEMLCFEDLFAAAGCNPEVVLDIGFGGGEGLIELAAIRPAEALIGVDVHTPGVATVLEAIDTEGWQHVRVVEGDVLELLPRIPVSSLAGVRLFFPDPWPKNKQRHRRLARPDVVPARRPTAHRRHAARGHRHRRLCHANPRGVRRRASAQRWHRAPAILAAAHALRAAGPR